MAWDRDVVVVIGLVVVVEEDAVVVVAVAVGVDAEPVVAITPAKAVSARIDPQITVTLTPDERFGAGGGGGGMYASTGGVQGGSVLMCRTSQDWGWGVLRREGQNGHRLLRCWTLAWS
jgi:hypothetical protein